MFLGTGTMVVCLKHVGITDSDRERLNMSVKTLASWLAHGQGTRPGCSSECYLFKVLIPVGCGERDHTVILQVGYTRTCLRMVSWWLKISL